MGKSSDNYQNSQMNRSSTPGFKVCMETKPLVSSYYSLKKLYRKCAWLRIGESREVRVKTNEGSMIINVVKEKQGSQCSLHVANTSLNGLTVIEMELEKSSLICRP